MVNRAVEPERVMDEALELAGKIARGPAVPIRKMKDSIGDSFSRNLEETLTIEAGAQCECFKTEDLKEGITAFLEKRAPNFKGR